MNITTNGGGLKMNEFYLIASTLLAFSAITLLYRFFGKIGLYCWIVFATIVANIEVIKCVDIFGMSSAMGNVIASSMFLCTDILSENNGGKESRKAVIVGFVFQIAFTIATQIALLYEPNENDFISPSLEVLFSITPRLTIASLICFLVSNTLDTYLYDWIGKHTKAIWAKNNLSTMTSQAIDTSLYALLAFTGVYEWEVIWEIFITAYVIKLLIALLDTPFAYLCKRIAQKQKY